MYLHLPKETTSAHTLTEEERGRERREKGEREGGVSFFTFFLPLPE
jgi:hypothetical protein